MTVSQPPKASPGLAWYLSLISVVLAVLLIAAAKTSHFSEGQEMAWLFSYLFPTPFALLALLLSTPDLIRRRGRGVLAWIPALAALALIAWVVGFVYFGAFR
jgi:hypothetical protein